MLCVAAWVWFCLSTEFVGTHRLRIWRHASSVAMPYMSVEAEAAVGIALATLSVALSATWQHETGMPKARAATWQTYTQTKRMHLKVLCSY